MAFAARLLIGAAIGLVIVFYTLPLVNCSSMLETVAYAGLIGVILGCGFEASAERFSSRKKVV